MKKRNITHGETGTRLYRIWKGIIQRTTNENSDSFKDYGGRGIGVCEEWEKSFDINLFSTVKLVQAFDGLWNEERGGSIVMLSSLAAYNRISAPYAYAAAKQGISVFSKYLSDDYAKRNIRVNSVVPGNVFYKGGRWEELVKRDETGVKEYIENSVPLKRFASPDEIANAIVFLASDCASFITGTSLVVDGGQNRSSV